MHSIPKIIGIENDNEGWAGQKGIKRSNNKAAKVRGRKQDEKELINSKQNEVERVKPNKSSTINILQLNSPIKKQIWAILVSDKAEGERRSTEQDKKGYYILIKTKNMQLSLIFKQHNTYNKNWE